MIFYLLFAAFLGGFGLGGYGVYQWKEGQIAQQAQRQAEAQKKIDAQAELILQQDNREAERLQAAWEKGEAQEKIITKTVYLKGQDYVREAPQVFTNPQCVLPDNSLQLYNSEIARVRVAAYEALGLPLPGPGTVDERGARDAVHIKPGTPGDVPGVHQELRPLPGPGGGPGETLPRPPKPTPTGK